ncbi:hypothetical protein K0T92_19985 [Paenibacillus oenotherae]|uniref:Uncharacterized protein n=1 Tax=Paenibacillus oenotherae TaxID=1435645 RepID=A0ABS7DAW7_9BACL|nr:hypothetical protein [Paenibacillus oenotherae]MBW7477000.1 hypothetical protein [Paenibacillus oenotherae]
MKYLHAGRHFTFIGPETSKLMLFRMFRPALISLVAFFRIAPVSWRRLNDGSSSGEEHGKSPMIAGIPHRTAS